MSNDSLSSGWNAKRYAQFGRWFRVEQGARENDSTRVLHASKTSRTHDERKFVVRIWTNSLTKQLKRLHGWSKTFRRVVSIRMRNVIHQRCSRRFLNAATEEIADSNDHAIRWNRRILRIGPRPHSTFSSNGFHQATIRHHQVLI